MEPRTAGFESDEGRTLRLEVKGRRATARVGDAESFPFNFEHLAYVERGLGYQAWGNGSHMVFRCEYGRVVIEFQGPNDRGLSLCRLSEAQFRAKVDLLGASTIRARVA